MVEWCVLGVDCIGNYEQTRCLTEGWDDWICHELLGQWSWWVREPPISSNNNWKLLEEGAFGAHPGHDAHILYTLSAIQVLVIQDALDKMDIDRVTKCTRITSPLYSTHHSPTQPTQLYSPSRHHLDASLGTDLERQTRDLHSVLLRHFPWWIVYHLYHPRIPNMPSPIFDAVEISMVDSAL